MKTSVVHPARPLVVLVFLSVATAQEISADAEATCHCSFGQRYNTTVAQVPPSMRYEGVQGSYRPVSCWRCAALSVFGLHNETFNIWTYSFGIVLMSLLAFLFWRYTRLKAKQCSEENLKPGARQFPPAWPLLTFDLMISASLFLAVLKHTFSCTPQAHNNFFWLLDQIGIQTGALGVEIAAVSYLFFRFPAKQRNEFLVASCMTSVVNAILTIAVSAFVSDTMLRSTLQVVLNVLVIGEILVLMVKVWQDNHMPEDWHFRRTIVHYVQCCSPAVLTALLLAAGIPERLRAGTFDLLGSSHQLMHVGVIASCVLFHYASVAFWKFLFDQHMFMQQYTGGLERLGSYELNRKGESVSRKCTIEVRDVDEQ